MLIMNKMGIHLLFSFLMGLSPFIGEPQIQQHKPRVIIMTDGEVDDRSSMVRFLLYTCDINLEAIIQTNSVYQKSGHSKEGWLENMLNAYGEIYKNLIKKNPDYPTAAEL